MPEPSRRATVVAVLLPLFALTVAPVTAGLQPAAPSVADSRAAWLRWLPPGARPSLETAQKRAHAVREAVATGSIASSVSAMMGESAPTPPASPVPTAADLARLGNLAPAVGRAVAGLETAVRRAAQIIGPIPASEARHLFHRVMTWATRTAAAGDPREAPAPPTATPAIRRATGAMPAATMLLAAALDRYLPVLLAADVPASPGTAAGCDRVDQRPYLCVGDTMDNVYTDDVALLIDLGGNDTYRNAAAGAPFDHAPGDLAYMPVSVNLDLGGDDLYAPTPDPDPLFHNVLANGAGTLGGVGILVDQAGDDVYSAAVEDPAQRARWGVSAQGAGLAGTGLLFDLAGEDRYEVGEGAAFAVAQGAALFCGAYTGTQNPRQLAGCPIGALVDRGGGNDRYEVRPGPAARGEGRQVDVQAYGNLGTGVLVDEGGADGFLIRTRTLPFARPDAPPAAAGFPPTSQVFGQAEGAFGANALLLTGTGDTTYEIDMRSDGRAFNRVWAQAAAIGQQGQAVIEDLGGNDLYRTEIDVVDRREVLVDDSCQCELAQALVDGRPTGTLYEIDTFLQGSGYLDATALIHDGGGNDTYLVSGRHRLEATLRDRLSSPTAPPVLAVRGYALPYIRGQGYANTSEAALVDEAGTDTYVLRALNETEGDATSDHAADEPQVSVYNPTFTLVGGQGVGNTTSGVLGALLDLGGTGDRFEAVSAGSATSSSGPQGEFNGRGEWPWLQGGFGGLFVALGSEPTIVSRPSRGVCLLSPGRRGFGTWLECYPTASDPENEREGSTPLLAPYGGGTAPLASGRAPALQFTADSATEGRARILGSGVPYTLDTPRLPVGVRLTDPDGKPIRGAVVHLTLQRGCHLLCTLGVPSQAAGRYWFNIWEIDAETDVDGVARASLPLRLQSFEWRPQYGELFRVEATFDGAAGIYPRHVALPVTLTKES